MSGAAKFLVTTIGGGLLLGAVGGHLANPVILERAGDEPWRHMLEPDNGAAGGGIMAETPPQDLRPYGGRYSYAPNFADETFDAWSDPYAETEWLEYGEDWPEPPTIAELDARWESETRETSAYGRTVELPPPSADSIAADAGQVAEEAEAASNAAETGSMPAEPRVARGELPAIW
jgi:hypothetical protein